MKLSDLNCIGLVRCPNGLFAYCYTCFTVVGTHFPLRHHLRKKHHFNGRLADFAALIRQRPDLHQALARYETCKVLPMPWLDDTPLCASLPTIQAWECLCCFQEQPFRCRFEPNMLRHLCDVHQQRKNARVKSCYHVITAQSWYPQRRDRYECMWRVVCPQTPSPPPAQVESPPPSPRIAADLLTEPGLHGTALKDDSNLFLERTGWIQAFKKQKYRQAMRQMTYIPKPECMMQLYDQVDTTQFLDNIIFEARDESVLDIIMAAIPAVFQRCKETLDTTALPLCYWLHSHSMSNSYPLPFSWLESAATLRQYTGYWKRLLSCLFRADQLPIDVEVKLINIQRYVSDDLQTQLHMVWQVASRIYAHQAEECSKDEIEDTNNYWLQSRGLTLKEDLYEKLFQLGVAIIMEPTTSWANTTSNLLVYFTGILSFNLKPRQSLSQPWCGFNPVGHCTTFFSGFIWISRLLVLEWALPRQAYVTLQRPSRESYDDPLTELNTLRRRYLVKNTLTVIGELLMLRNIGKGAQRRDSARVHLYWSKDLQELRIHQETLRINDFRQWVHTSIANAQAKLSQLFVSEPPPDLPLLSDLIDDVSCREPGLSFLTLPANRARLEACTQSFTQDAIQHFVQDGQWDQGRVKDYLAQHTAFLRYLLLVLYQSGGQPPRGPELLSIKVCNTQSSLRNIYIYNGLLCSIVQYNKGRGERKEAFFVVRFFPRAVSQILYQYLVYIRPFIRHLLASSRLPGPVQPQYLWPTYHGLSIEPVLDLEENDDDDDNNKALEEEAIASKEAISSAENQGFWTTASLSKILIESSMESQLSMTLKVGICRHIIIGIAKEHLLGNSLPSSAQSQNKFIRKAFNNDLSRKFLAWQAGHSVFEDMKTYGLNGMYPTKLQPVIIEFYHAASLAYHNFLGIGEKEESQQYDPELLEEPQPACPIYDAESPAAQNHLSSKEDKGQLTDFEPLNEPQPTRLNPSCHIDAKFPAARNGKCTLTTVYKRQRLRTNSSKHSPPTLCNEDGGRSRNSQLGSTTARSMPAFGDQFAGVLIESSERTAGNTNAAQFQIYEDLVNNTPLNQHEKDGQATLKPQRPLTEQSGNAPAKSKRPASKPDRVDTEQQASCQRFSPESPPRSQLSVVIPYMSPRRQAEYAPYVPDEVDDKLPSKRRRQASYRLCISDGSDNELLTRRSRRGEYTPNASNESEYELPSAGCQQTDYTPPLSDESDSEPPAKQRR